MALIEREAAKAKKVYCEERHEYVVPLAELDWLPTIDPVHAAGGCRCGECKNYVDTYGTGKMMCMRPIRSEDYLETGYIFPLELDTKETEFCSYGEPREAQDDG